MKYYRLGGLDHKCLFSHGSGGWNSKIKLSAGEGSHGFSPWLAEEGLFIVSSQICVLIYCSYKAIHVELGPVHMSLFYFNYPFQGSVSKYCHILRYLQLELQHVNLGWEDTSP